MNRGKFITSLTLLLASTVASFANQTVTETLSVSVDFEQSVNLIMTANSTTREIAERIHFESWVFVHGIATMIATSFLTLDWDAISDMLTDVYQGLKAKHLQ